MHKLESRPLISLPKRWCRMDSSTIWSCQTTEVKDNLRLTFCLTCFDGPPLCDSLFCDPAAYSAEIHLHYKRWELIKVMHSLVSLVFFLMLWYRKVRRVFLLPAGFHLCLSDWDNRFQWCCQWIQEDWMWGHCCLSGLTLLPFRLVFKKLCILHIHSDHIHFY